MTGQQLKNSILQEAIQGRLFPNVLEPGEKTGAELLQFILAERQKKENADKGKKAKKLSLSTIEEEPWELPKEWCWCLLPNVATIEYGFPFDSTKFNTTGQGIPLVRIRDVVPGYTKTYTTESASKEYLVQKGDMLTGMDGNFNVNFWDSDIAYLNQRVCRITAIKQIIEQRYLYYYLPVAFKEIEEGVSFVTVKHLSDKHLKALAIPLPPLSIQRKIVEILDGVVPQIDAFDKAAEELESLNKVLPEKLRKSVLQEAIHGTLVSNDIPDGEATAQELLQQILNERQDRENKEKGKKAKKLTISTIEEEPWELPKCWCWCRLGDVFEMQAGKNINASVIHEIRSKETPYPCYGGNGIRGYVKGYNTEGIHTIVGRQGALCGNVKYAEGPFYATEHAVVVSMVICDVMWSYYFLIACNLNQYATKTAQPGLSVAKILETPFPLPPISIQRRIVKKIEEVFAAIDNLPA